MGDLANTVFQIVWPIVDETMSTSELYTEAALKFQGLANVWHVEILGPPVWSIRPAAEVLGWESYAPGLVLIGTAPAEGARVVRPGRHDIDHVEVETALLRNYVPRRAADRYELVRRLSEDEKRDHATISARTGLTEDAINQILVRTKRRARTRVAA